MLTNDWIENTSAQEIGFEQPLENRYTKFDWSEFGNLETFKLACVRDGKKKLSMLYSFSKCIR